jgi:hypothetical protein
LRYQPLNPKEPPVRLHQVNVCGLSPGTRYHYRVGGDGAWSDVSSFSTAPAVDDPDRTVVIGVTGDSRNEPTILGRLLEDMTDRGVDFHLFSGDIVDLSFVQGEWDDWFDAVGRSFATAPFISANGNHDALALNYVTQIALPGNEQFFAFDYGPAHIVVLDDSARNYDEEQVAFLEADLPAVDRERTPWVIAMHHRPIWSFSNHSSTARLQREWMPIYERHGVDLVLNGHDHNYQRMHPLRGGEIVDATEGVVYVVTGGGGAPLYGLTDNERQAVTTQSHHSLVLTVSTESIEGTAYGVDGTVLDTFSL